MPQIICLGELLIDMVSMKANVTLAEAPGFVRAPGGAPANVAVGIARLGGSSGFIGCVGDDHFGVFLRDCLQKENVEISHLHYTSDARTTLAFIAVRSDQAKEIVFYRHPGADMMLSPDTIDHHYFKHARCFHFGSISMKDEPSRTATLKALRIARDCGLMISYDPNYRPDIWDSATTAQERIQSVFDKVDIIKISEEEWNFVTGTHDFTAGAEMFFSKGVKLVLVSRGENGSWFSCAGHEGHVPAFRVRVIETTGAGDAFMAALLLKLQKIVTAPEDLRSIEPGTLASFVRWANAAGALACTKPGAIPALPYADEVERFLAATVNEDSHCHEKYP